MKRAAKSKAKGGAKRDLFAELSEGMEALADARQGKRTSELMRWNTSRRRRSRRRI